MDLTDTRRAGPFHKVLFLFFFAALCLSGIHPTDRFVWVSQSAAPILGAALLYAIRRRYLPSRPTACLLLLQGLLLLTGAHYGFHAIPFFRFRMSDGSLRACVDWLTHFVDGLVYARITIELRAGRPKHAAPIRPWDKLTAHGKTAALALCVSLALATLWELVEWLARLATHDRFVMTGGYSADTLMDMLLTVMGTLTAVVAGTAWRIMANRCAANRRNEMNEPEA